MGTRRFKVAEIDRIELQQFSLKRRDPLLLGLALGNVLVLRGHLGQILALTAGFRRRSVEEFSANARLPFEALAASPSFGEEFQEFQRSEIANSRARKRAAKVPPSRPSRPSRPIINCPLQRF